MMGARTYVHTEFSFARNGQMAFQTSLLAVVRGTALLTLSPHCRGGSPFACPGGCGCSGPLSVSPQLCRCS